MNAQDALAVIRAISLLLDSASSFGINAQRLLDIRQAAQAEGRDISNEELELLALEAQQAIDALRDS